MESTEGTSLRSMINLGAVAALTASCNAGEVEYVIAPFTLRMWTPVFVPARPAIWKDPAGMRGILACSTAESEIAGWILHWVSWRVEVREKARCKKGLQPRAARAYSDAECGGLQLVSLASTHAALPEPAAHEV